MPVRWQAEISVEIHLERAPRLSVFVSEAVFSPLPQLLTNPQLHIATQADPAPYGVS